MKIKKGDQVLIISGKDKGRKGKVLEVLTSEGRLLVEGFNLMKKHVKPKKQGEKGQIVQLPGPISSSCVKIICPKCSKAARIGYRIEGKNKYRICKKCKQEI
ncbi:50S ribosomal protein L24 [Parcubacteria bacterium DG_72]|nr:MAG: 50S ribosomal protein L24 [Parcubacteria bacterium DG_72]